MYGFMDKAARLLINLLVLVVLSLTGWIWAQDALPLGFRLLAVLGAIMVSIVIFAATAIQKVE